jgi:hypothetical protein
MCGGFAVGSKATMKRKAGVWIALFGVFVLAMLLVGCGPRNADEREIKLDRQAYLTPIAEARSNGLEPYWLGPSFAAGSMTYSYIETKYPEGIAGVRVQGLEMTYHEPDGANRALSIKTFPLDEWSMVEDAVRNPKQANPDRSDVTINGIQAELLAYTSPTRPINGYVLIIETGRSAVVVTVPSSGSATPGGPDLNPLIDLDTFLAVMESLQPYSE